MRKRGRILLAGLLSAVLGAESLQAEGPDWLAKSRAPGLSSGMRRAYGEIAKLQGCHLTRFSWPGGFDIGSIETQAGEKPGQALREIGLDALPALVEAMGDPTPTGVVEPDRFPSGPSKRWKVGGLAVRLLCGVAERDFALAKKPKETRLLWDDGSHPERLPQYQKLVMAWYQANRTRTPEERKLDELQDEVNRRHAVSWLGKHPSDAGRAAIILHIGQLAAEKEQDFILSDEMSEAAAALATIGGQEGLPSVRLVCQKLTETSRSEKKLATQAPIFFWAFQARAKLGEKEQALRDLEEVYGSCSENMDHRGREEYGKLMEELRSDSKGKAPGDQ